jgi:hypothetical protein
MIESGSGPHRRTAGLLLLILTRLLLATVSGRSWSVAVNWCFLSGGGWSVANGASEHVSVVVGAVTAGAGRSAG